MDSAGADVLESRLDRERALPAMLDRYLQYAATDQPVHTWPANSCTGPFPRPAALEGYMPLAAIDWRATTAGGPLAAEANSRLPAPTNADCLSSRYPDMGHVADHLPSSSPT
jgi:hypothetical protein